MVNPLSSLHLLLLPFQEDGNCVIPRKCNKASNSETKSLIEPLGNVLNNTAHLLLRQNTAAVLGKMSGRGILQNTCDCGAQYECLRELNTGTHWEKHYKLLDVMALLNTEQQQEQGIRSTRKTNVSPEIIKPS